MAEHMQQNAHSGPAIPPGLSEESVCSSWGRQYDMQFWVYGKAIATISFLRFSFKVTGAHTLYITLS